MQISEAFAQGATIASSASVSALACPAAFCPWTLCLLAFLFMMNLFLTHLRWERKRLLPGARRQGCPGAGGFQGPLSVSNPLDYSQLFDETRALVFPALNGHVGTAQRG